MILDGCSTNSNVANGLVNHSINNKNKLKSAAEADSVEKGNFFALLTSFDSSLTTGFSNQTGPIGVNLAQDDPLHMIVTPLADASIPSIQNLPMDVSMIVASMGKSIEYGMSTQSDVDFTSATNLNKLSNPIAEKQRGESLFALGHPVAESSMANGLSSLGSSAMLTGAVTLSQSDALPLLKQNLPLPTDMIRAQRGQITGQKSTVPGVDPLMDGARTARLSSSLMGRGDAGMSISSSVVAPTVSVPTLFDPSISDGIGGGNSTSANQANTKFFLPTAKIGGETILGSSAMPTGAVTLPQSDALPLLKQNLPLTTDMIRAQGGQITGEKSTAPGVAPLMDGARAARLSSSLMGRGDAGMSISSSVVAPTVSVPTLVDPSINDSIGGGDFRPANQVNTKFLIPPLGAGIESIWGNHALLTGSAVFQQSDPPIISTQDLPSNAGVLLAQEGKIAGTAPISDSISTPMDGSQIGRGSGTLMTGQASDILDTSSVLPTEEVSGKVAKDVDAAMLGILPSHPLKNGGAGSPVGAVPLLVESRAVNTPFFVDASTNAMSGALEGVGNGDRDLRLIDQISAKISIPMTGPGVESIWGNHASVTGSRVDTPTVMLDSSMTSLESSVANTVNYWVTQGVQNAELTMEGFEGQSVEVSISLKGDEARIDFRTDQPEIRQILEGAVSHLKDLLANEGLVLSGVSVGASSQDGAGTPERRNSPDARQAAITTKDAPSTEVIQQINKSDGRTLDLFV